MEIRKFENVPKSYEKPGNLNDFRVFTGTPKGTRLIKVSLGLSPTATLHMIEESQPPYGMPSVFYGLSHGLKSVPRTLFTPAAPGPAFRVPPVY